MSERIVLPILASFLLMTVATQAAVTKPLERVRGTADKIIGILNDAGLQGDAKRPERHRLMREELEVCFDWNAVCRSCLGRQWSKLSKQQQSEFIELFKQFLERTYLDRIEPYYNELDRIDYLGEQVLEQDYASVKTVVRTKRKIDHPVEYRLQKSSAGEWRVYDVVIEGVSLAKNYRSQFEEIITRSSYQALVDDLKAKIAGNN